MSVETHEPIVFELKFISEGFSLKVELVYIFALSKLRRYIIDLQETTVPNFRLLFLIKRIQDI